MGLKKYLLNGMAAVSAFAAHLGFSSDFPMIEPKRNYVRQPGAGVARAKAREAAFRKADRLRLKDAMQLIETRQQRRSFAIRAR